MGARGKMPISSMPVATAINKPSQEDAARERRYKAEDAMRDLERAETHKKDKKLMSDVKSLAKEKVNSLKKLC